GPCPRDLSLRGAATNPAGNEHGRDASLARRRQQPQGPHLAQSRLRLRPARQRGGQAESQAYRQRAEDHAGRAVQRPKGPALAKAGDRNVMLSPETLGLLRQWWKARRSRYDAATPVAERWLFPRNRRRTPMPPRQLSRLFHEAADAAGIRRP